MLISCTCGGGTDGWTDGAFRYGTVQAVDFASHLNLNLWGGDPPRGPVHRTTPREITNFPFSGEGLKLQVDVSGSLTLEGQ